MQVISNQKGNAVIDTCLLINWANFSTPELLEQAFSRLFIPEKTFPEVKSLKATRLAARWLSRRYLIISPVTTLDEQEITAIVDEAAGILNFQH